MSFSDEQSQQKINDRLGAYRPPTPVTIPKFKKIQEKCLELGLLIDQECPNSPEKSTAITLLTQVKMMANAAVAIYTPPEIKVDDLMQDLNAHGGHVEEPDYEAQAEQSRKEYEEDIPF